MGIVSNKDRLDPNLYTRSFFLNIKVVCTRFWHLSRANIFVADCTYSKS